MSLELVVAAEILGYQRRHQGKLIPLETLLEEVKGEVKGARQADVETALDILSDKGVVRSRMTAAPSGELVHGYKISGEAQGYVEVVAEQLGVKLS
jgi:hypothetical protein